MLKFFSAESLSIIDGSNSFPATSLSIIGGSLSIIDGSLFIIDNSNSFPATSLSFLDGSNSFPAARYLLSAARYLLSTAHYLLSTIQIPFQRPRYLFSTARIRFRRPRSSIATVQASIPARCNHPRAACLASAITIPLRTRLEICRFHFGKSTLLSRHARLAYANAAPNDARRAPRGATRASAHQEMTVRRAAWTAPASMQTNARS